MNNNNKKNQTTTLMFKEQLSPYTSLELPCGLNVCKDHPLLYLLQWEINSYLTFLPDNSTPPPLPQPGSQTAGVAMTTARRG